MFDRDGSSYFKLWKPDGGGFALIDPSFSKFSARDSFWGFDGEAYIGRRYGSGSIEVFAGGGTIRSEASFSGVKAAADLPGYLLTISSPTPNNPGHGNVNFNWITTNRFAQGDVAYKNSFERDDFFLGIRPGIPFGEMPGSLKDGGFKDLVPMETSVSMIKPMLFASGGRMTARERYAGITDGEADYKALNIAYNYDNKVTSDFVGLGAGLSARGPLSHVGGVPVGYFGSAKATVEFQDARGAAGWTYAQLIAGNFGILGCQDGLPIKPPCNAYISNPNAKSAFKSLQDSETTYGITAELGLTFAIASGFDIEIGGRYRRFDIPQVIVNGVDDAHIKFNSADEIGGFAGVRAEF